MTMIIKVNETPKLRELGKLLKMLHNSQTLKIKHGWSREGGAGFIKEDIQNISRVGKQTIKIVFGWKHTQEFKTIDLNLRETEETIKYIKEQYAKEVYNAIINE